MAFCTLNYYSAPLNKMTAASIVLPEPDVAGPFSVLYLLHGYSDDHSAWARRTSIERYAAQWPLMVVMPDGGHGFYCNAAQESGGYQYEDALLHLVDYIDARFHTRAERGGRCIGGLSMGGYGALHTALKHPQMFGSAHSHSGAVDFGHETPRWIEGPRVAELQRICGEHSRGTDYDLYALAERVRNGEPSTHPALRIDCGTDDFLIEQNRDFHTYLDEIGLAHEYAEYSGGHSWEYWDEHIQEALAFHARHLKLGKPE